MTNAAPCALVVDDNEAIRRIVSEMLTRAGYTVRIFGTAHEALLGARASPPDVYVLDVRLPDLNGRELCRALKADDRTRRPVLIISAESTSADIAEARAAGCDDFLPKPFGKAELVSRTDGLRH